LSILRNLEVPYFSQRVNKAVWKKKYSSGDKITKNKPELIGTIDENTEPVSMAKQSCNVTCLAMILHYFGVTSDTPDVMMKKVFEPSSEQLKTYTSEQKELVEKTYSTDSFFEPIKNIKTFAEKFYHVTVETSTTKKMDAIKNEILSGYPVLVSCGILRPYLSSEYVLPSKKKAYAKVFNRELSTVSASSYDNKLAEYINQINEKKQQLLNTSLSKEERANITTKINTLEANKKMLEDKYTEVFNNYLNDYRFHGHYVVIRGITDNGVIINDPWGKPVIETITGKANYSVVDGDNIEISNELFDKQYFENKRFFSCLIVRAKRWNFISHDKQFDLKNENFLENCHSAELFEHGGFPIKRSNLWHNGLHFGSKIGNYIYPIGPGQLIAARIINKDVGNDKAPRNGSRCFVLIKHQIKLNSVLKDFFVCYMHLKSVENFENIANEYPIKKTEIKWIDDLLKRAKKRKRISALSSVKDRDFYEVDDIEGTTAVGKLPNSGVFVINKIENGKIYFYYEKDNTIKEYWVQEKHILNADDKTQNYKNKIEELKTGKVVYFTDIPEDNCIEVSNSYSLGVMGNYSGLSCDNKKDSIHIEIFSNSLIVDNSDNSFKIIKKSDMPAELNNSSSLCNRKEMISFFENKKLYGNSIDCFFNLKQDGVICKSEMINFYNNYGYSKIFENYIVQHISEWSDKIDWESSIENAKGVPNKYFLEFLPKNEDYVGTLKEYVEAVYNPYKWFNNECISAMKTEDNDLKKGIAYFYHPARFIKWLYDNNK
jgi:hypothetical protein